MSTKKFGKEQGERLRRACAFLGIKPEEARVFAGVTPQQWRRYLKGKNEPGAGKLRFLEDKRISIDWIFSGEGEMITLEPRRTDKFHLLGVPDEQKEMDIVKLGNEAVDVLKSKTVYAKTLAANIKAFTASVAAERANEKLASQVDQLRNKVQAIERDMEKRVAELVSQKMEEILKTGEMEKTSEKGESR